MSTAGNSSCMPNANGRSRASSIEIGAVNMFTFSATSTVLVLSSPL